MRIIWIDIVKGIAMLFVMLHHHVLGLSEYIYRLFYSPFFLTAFFVTAGYVFSRNQRFSEFLKKKIRTLLIPMFLLAIIGIITQRSFSVDSFCRQIIDLLVQKGTGGYRMWFVAAMFVACVAFYFVAYLDSMQLILACFALAVINIVWQRYYPDVLLPWHLEMLGIACFWMGFGYLLRKSLNQKGVEFITLRVQILVLGAYLMLLFCSYRWLGITYISLSGYHKHVIAYFILNGAGVIWLCVFANSRFPVYIEKFLVFIGQNTLFYFAFHGKLQTAMIVLLTKLNLMDIVMRCQYITFPMLVFIEAILLIIPCVVFSKVLPIAVGKKRE